MLDHANVIKLYSTFQDSERLYFVLEYCEGGDMSKLISSYCKPLYKLATLPLEVVKFYAAETVSGLDYLNSKEIIHRDLKVRFILTLA
jgi:serine/threonine protein kinase